MNKFPQTEVKAQSLTSSFFYHVSIGPSFSISVLKLAAGLIKTEGDSSPSRCCVIHFSGCCILLSSLSCFAHLTGFCEYTDSGFIKYQNEVPVVVDSRCSCQLKQER